MNQRMVRGIFLVIFLFNGAVTVKTKPNIIFILVDDLGFNDVSWHNPGVFMPNIDRLARDGIILEQSYVQPVCTPTRAALMTGKYPFTIGRQGGPIKPTRPTGLPVDLEIIPQVLKKAGYRTHMIGKWHLGFCKWEYTPTYRGFDSFYGFYTGSQSYVSHTRSDLLNEDQRVKGYDFRKDLEVFFPANGEYSTFSFAKRAQEIIHSHNSKDPFFIYLSFQAVHGPLDAPLEYVNLYREVEDEDRRTYLGMITAMDDAVGSIVDSLKMKGVFEDTIIVFSTDNGGSKIMSGSNWPLKGHKSTLYEGGIRGPAFIHYSKMRMQGTVHRGLFHVVDWLPTLASVAGTSSPAVDGVNQWLDLEGTSSVTARSHVVYNIQMRNGTLKSSIRKGKYKLVIGETRGKEWIPPPEGLKLPPLKYQVKKFRTETSSIRHQLSPFSVLTRSEAPTSSIESFNSTKIEIDFPLPVFSPDEDYEEDTNFKKDFKLKYCKNETKNECTRRMETELYSMFKVTDDFFKNKDIHMELYDVEGDPHETTNIIDEHPQVVQEILQILIRELKRAVPRDLPPPDPHSDPDNFGGTFSPGWC